MRGATRVILTAGLLSLGFALAGCADFDPEKLDVFGVTKKKPLPGERKEGFEGGTVPGATQGVPPELMRGYQAPAEPAPDPAVIAAAKAAQEEKPPPKPPKPKKTATATPPKPRPQQQPAQPQPG